MWRVTFLCTFCIISSYGHSRSIKILAFFTLTNCSQYQQDECKNAVLNEKQMHKHHQIHEFEDVEFCTVNAENDHRKVMNILLTLREVDHIFCRDGTTIRFDSSRVIIFTYVSFELTQIVSSIILPSNEMLLISVTNQPMYPAYYVQHPLAVYSYEASFGTEAHKDSLLKIKNELGVSYGGILNIFNGTQNLGDKDNALVCSSQDKSALCVYSQENPTDCYKEKDINVNNITQIDNLKAQFDHDQLTFVILSGEKRLLQVFEEKFGTTPSLADKYFLLWYVIRVAPTTKPVKPTDYFNSDVLSNFLGAYAINKVLSQ